ncbi:cytidine deaminase-like protein [Heterostelium album PN500]|uniref:Cytidine deaminase-like protein n=1 Tax=Heterostelium pallidum (strain ATCC 26659 / Pp 5 / PN500) TaxID=670386 RepID=D3B1A4_HETP5|nr:cytidine deaminase-like protein [Heterostelium album PN500]EFA85078.1 cytidine deaminase-like protein [Heterostelium album PN500]|eukprot:XP_020437188.1 cytidine deaminase-like protein [Heterostelium album PN500]
MSGVSSTTITTSTSAPASSSSIYNTIKDVPFTTTTTSTTKTAVANNNNKQNGSATIVEIESLSKEEINELRSNIHPILSDDESKGLELVNMFVVEVVPQAANKLIGELSKLLNKCENDKYVLQQYSHLKKMRKIQLSPKITTTSIATTETSTLTITISSSSTTDSDNNNNTPSNKNKNNNINNNNNSVLELLIAPEENYPNLQSFYQQHIDNEQNNEQESDRQPIVDIINSHNNNNYIYKDKTEYQRKIIQFLIDNKLSLKIVKIPKNPPLTHDLWLEWNKLWPMTFRVHCFSTPLVETLEDKEIVEMNTFMKKAIEQANIGKSLGFNPVGAVLVDPETNTIHGAGFDQTPGNHMNEITNTTTVKYHLSPILSHCTMNLIHQLANQHIERCVQKSGTAGMPALASMQQTPNSEDDAYLATDLYLYITREPCIMCSMALVHSRIKRVIFGAVQPNAGGLGGCLKVHTQKSINHRFQVYHGILENQCKLLFENKNNNNDNK